MTRKRPIRVLHIAGTVSPGGIETFLMNLHTHIDRDRITFDYAVHSRAEGDYGDRIKALSGAVYLLPRFSSDFFGNLRELKRLVAENGYDVVVRHTPNAMVTPQLLAAKKSGARTICHAHNETDAKKIAHCAGRLLMDAAADVRVACSERAGRWMFGAKPFTVVKNAIDVPRFAYSEEGEARVREEFHLAQAHLYASIANFRREKNHAYLLEVFRVIREKDPAARLLLIGDGELRGEIETGIREKQLEESIILAGTRSDVADVMSAADVLLFPSLFEGLPVTLIEAQAAALPALVSDRVTGDVEITEGLVRFADIGEEPAVWAKAAAEMMQNALEKDKRNARVQQTGCISAHGYDMETVSRDYQKLIEGLVDQT